MDTANDFRIRLAERGLKDAERLVHGLRIQRRKEIANKLKNLQSELQTVKYSYLEPEELVSLLDPIAKVADEIRKTTKGAEKTFNLKTFDYWLEYVSHLPALMRRGKIKRAYEAIRYFGGKILSRTSIDGLWLCTVDCGFRMEIVTNDESFKPNDSVVIAYLPPKEFGDVISEGMFVPVSAEKKGELDLEDIRRIAGALREVESIVIELIS